LQVKDTAGEVICCGIAFIFVWIAAPVAPGVLDCTGCPDSDAENITQTFMSTIRYIVDSRQKDHIDK
jgi:hypothetical protein